MERKIPFSDEHLIFRDSLKKFLVAEVADKYSLWEEEGIVPREIWKKFGDMGFLLPWADEKYGGSGADFIFSMIIIEELTSFGAGGIFIPLHNDIVAPYIQSFGSEEQRKRWFPKCVTGENILAIAMTEPEAGSDLASMKTKAVKDGDSWLINGRKTFISNGILSDLVVVAAKTGDESVPHKSVSLFMVERDTPGFTRGKPIKKIGLKAQDTAELFFDDCRIPAGNLIGQEGMGFIYLMQKLQQERLVCAIGSQAGAEQCLDLTMKYVQERNVFGRPLSKFQNTRFSLAEIASEIAVGRSFVDNLIVDHMAGKDVVKETCMAKYWVCEMYKSVSDRCLQFFGGYGYCDEYPISKYYTGARIQTIYAGTSEVMKMIISKMMGL